MTSKIPKITEVERFRYAPDDRFVLHCDGLIEYQQARAVVNLFRVALDLPDDAPVAILDQDWTLVIVSPDEELGDADGSE